MERAFSGGNRYGPFPGGASAGGRTERYRAVASPGYAAYRAVVAALIRGHSIRHGGRGRNRISVNVVYFGRDCHPSFSRGRTGFTKGSA